VSEFALDSKEDLFNDFSKIMACPHGQGEKEVIFAILCGRFLSDGPYSEMFVIFSWPKISSFSRVSCPGARPGNDVTSTLPPVTFIYYGSSPTLSRSNQGSYEMFGHSRLEQRSSPLKCLIYSPLTPVIAKLILIRYSGWRRNL